MLSDTSPVPATDADADAAVPTGAARARRSLFAVLVPAVTALAGLMFAMSFQAARGAGDLRSVRDLPALILDRDSAVSNKVAQVDALQKQIDELTAAQKPADSEIDTLDKAAAGLTETAGMGALRGPGISVTLTDSTTPLTSLPDTFGPDDIVVHQQDVQAVVNAMWSGGAEAMMIQDQRVVSTSAVRCVGNTLILQGRVYAPPYTIRAIGNVERMIGALDTDPTIQIYQQYVQAVGLGYDLVVEDSLDVPAYTGQTAFTHAVPLT